MVFFGFCLRSGSNPDRCRLLYISEEELDRVCGKAGVTNAYFVFLENPRGKKVFRERRHLWKKIILTL
jgi:hypothetical protein